MALHIYPKRRISIDGAKGMLDNHLNPFDIVTNLKRMDCKGGRPYSLAHSALFMKLACAISSIAAVFSLWGSAMGQSFENLRFEQTTITPVLINPYNNFYDYIATVPGWTWSPAYNFAAVDDSTMVSLNDIALDAPAITLQSADSPYEPAIQGNYSIFLQGGDAVYETGASIWQTGQIPVTAQSITYWGGPLNVTFNGQPLDFVAISNASNYSIWQADISAYAGQTGELEFNVPSDVWAYLDNIQFSSVPVPEPKSISLICISLFSILFAGRIPARRKS